MNEDLTHSWSAPIWRVLMRLVLILPRLFPALPFRFTFSSRVLLSPSSPSDKLLLLPELKKKILASTHADVGTTFGNGYRELSYPAA